MINILDVSRRYANEWVVLDPAQRVIDHGPELGPLCAKYAALTARLTFYFACDVRG